MQEQPQRPTTTTKIETPEIGYFSVTATGVETKDIKSSEITFEVDNTILTTKKISPTDIILKRYTTQWDTLPTIYKGIKEGKHTYTATTPGFSYFAITTKEETIPSQEPITNKTTNKETTTAIQEQPIQTTQKSNTLKTIMILIIIIVLITGITIYIIDKHKNKETVNENL